VTYRSDDEATRGRIREAERDVREVVADRERLSAELARMRQLESDLDEAIKRRRSATIDARGYLRMCALMTMILGGGVAVEIAKGYSGWLSGGILAGSVATLCLFGWRAHRMSRQTEARLAEHDARMAAEAEARARASTDAAHAEEEAEEASFVEEDAESGGEPLARKA
jgi:hypothetical protein